MPGLRLLTLLLSPPGTLFSPYSHVAQPEVRCKIVNNWNAFGKQPVGPNIWAIGRMLDENPQFCRGTSSPNASCGAHASFRSGLKYHLLRRYSLTALFKIGSLPSPLHPTFFHPIAFIFTWPYILICQTFCCPHSSLACEWQEERTCLLFSRLPPLAKSNSQFLELLFELYY